MERFFISLLLSPLIFLLFFGAVLWAIGARIVELMLEAETDA